ncbi:coiled-coil domain-containing protein 50-like isoform X2 [Daphnia pulicaria]|uniref:coiled-coil domain-containing protein 50-like isoform X2 n=1 Tax=Daphnia pulicaria TaxID=35523 RepID=UPI001EEC77F3|nr:coiled-coil domain-containing protein 50-like isoform X2 [Daphnia pulicaria]XP_046654614.1 coiled-coil domain-containing protein 50-like isoform X2 [Daphnia pulicaria]
MDEPKPLSGVQNKRLVQEVMSSVSSQRTSTCPKTGVFHEVCREWLVIEDGALAHQLQDQEIAAHYGHNRERNRIVRGDVSQARTEQEDELKQALALQQFQQELRLQQEREDEEAAKQLAEELEREEELQRRRRVIQDEKLAQKLQIAAISKPIGKSHISDKELRSNSVEPLCSSIKMLDMNQPMSEEEAREWQERCDAEMARKLQQEEEEESKFRRDVTDLSRKLAIEAKDLELARILQEKEKARLRKAKEKARLKAQQAQLAQLSQQNQHGQQITSGVENHNRQQSPFCVPETQNIAACIDPTWSRRYCNPEIRPESGQRTQIPITDLDFPAPVQPIVSGHRRTSSVSRSESPAAEPSNNVEQSRNKSRKGCSHQ